MTAPLRRPTGLVDAEGNPVVAEFPSFIDSNMRDDLANCQHLFYYRHVLGLRPKGPMGWHLHFGHCFAKGLEVFRQSFYGEGVGVLEAQARGAEAILKAWGDYPTVAPDDAKDSIKKKSLFACLDAFKSYIIQYPPTTDHIKPLVENGRANVEFSFALPIPDCLHPDTGEPMIYCGRFDMIGSYGKAIFGLDDKTASQLGLQWTINWPLRTQLTGYVWAGKNYGYPIQGMVVRGVGIMTRDITFAEDIQQRSEWEIDRWLDQMRKDIERAKLAWKSGEWEYNLGMACTKFGGCDFLRLDKVKNQEPWISTEYVVSRWDPLAENDD